MGFKVIEDLALADRLHLAGLLWWKGDDMDWKWDDPDPVRRGFTPDLPSISPKQLQFAIQVEE